MFSHIMVGTNNIEQSKKFYDAVFGLFGTSEPFRNQAATGHHRIFYRHDGNTFSISEPINGEKATPANGSTIGFTCSSSEQVQQFHDVALAHGGQTAEDPPSLRDGGAMGPMHLAYVRDPDGNKLCAIYRAG
ncbi:MAG: catechol 2,3-dioxygenase-like lactoylglutathione lyase family enzyme [Bradyrhizobium sp.]|jgi:catechol 2,3-dioxygenase-like lactoylglutathione lyase family enzyme